MREIRFRAWNKTENKWEQCFMLNPNGVILDPRAGHPALSVYKQECLVLEQFTGLKDKHGRDIWEGGIVKVRGSGVHVPITWENLGCSYCCGTVGFIDYSDDEVIGNVHENPDLLK